jgi:hypothetical protein
MTNRILQIISVLFLSGFAFGQVTELGGPLGWANQSNFKTIDAVQTMPKIDLKALEAEDIINDATKDAPWRFGYKFETNIRLEKNSNNWNELPNGDRVWRTEIKCVNALSINLILSNLFIPEGSYLYLYDKEKTNRVGAYTSRNNREDGLLSTELIIGDDIIVEYFEPLAVKNQGRFTISNVIHGYRSVGIIQDQLEKGINDSGDCHYDINCPLGNGWENEARSAAMIVVNGNGICSGALINNTCEDGRPLILTANHCMSSGTTTWSFRFNWASPSGTESCASVLGSTDPGLPYDQTANGATVLANGTQSDFLLLEADNMTLADATAWNLFYAGWNHDDNTIITEATCIHHPVGDVMKITREEDIPFHSVGGGAQVWWVSDWEFGTTQGGSSGSPLFDQNHRIVGQLFGGQAGCAGTSPNQLFDYYGRLGVSWDLGVSAHLAPAACGQALVVDGWDPNGALQFDDASAQSISSPEVSICGLTFEPEVAIRNAGDNNLTECILTYNIDGGTDLTYNWTGLLGPNDSETIVLPGMNSTDGVHTFNAFTSDPNATFDSNTGNDTVSKTFTLFANSVATFINISTDCFGYETAWELSDAGSVLVASGGNQSIGTGGNQTASTNDFGAYGSEQTITEKYCLAVGCYDFIIFDDWGDGLEGSSQASCTTDGNYTITSASGFVFASMQNAAFDVFETNDFCVTADAGLDGLSLDDFQLYPNPSGGLINISLTAVFQSNFNLEIWDLSGRLIRTMQLKDNMTTVDLSSVSQGTYFFTVSDGVSVLTKKVLKN